MLSLLPQTLWPAVTWFGDSGFLLPASLWITAWLGLPRGTRVSAVRWVLVFGLGCSVILVSKLAFLGWGVGIAAIDFTGFSGHTALSASIWPVAAWLMASRQDHRARVAAAVIGLMFAAVIGVSRIALDAHSYSEVLAGFLLGAAVSGMFLWWQHRSPHPRLSWLLVALSLATPALLQRPGTAAPTQSALEVIAMRLAGTDRVYTRADLLARRNGSRNGIE
ncbi:phosphatase PAP2 family protein [Variovorax sp. Sphag1AA]|uniref:phosphatase PAP2 family protein n=1 Tax=Variovorax sp. Sphag1AA TaxID=2587027 RepID=UPI001617B414|nr:phosphatase PAP2 family protein [Variovorax sp. Sphag1AA]MBB3180015.1 membrane-associated phospholipid phosphatase [Variovorax sp. Sphag1AA]